MQDHVTEPIMVSGVPASGRRLSCPFLLLQRLMGIGIPHVLKLKDGKFLTAFAIEDVLDAVEEYAGDEVRRYLAENLTDTAALEQELDETYKEHEKELEQLTDYQRSVLCDIQEEADALDELLDAPRLDRKKLKKAASSIWLMCNREL